VKAAAILLICAALFAGVRLQHPSKPFKNFTVAVKNRYASSILKTR
jgi:hypothetical protein